MERFPHLRVILVVAAVCVLLVAAAVVFGDAEPGKEDAGTLLPAPPCWARELVADGQVLKKRFSGHELTIHVRRWTPLRQPSLAAWMRANQQTAFGPIPVKQVADEIKYCDQTEGRGAFTSAFAPRCLESRHGESYSSFLSACAQIMTATLYGPARAFSDRQMTTEFNEISFGPALVLRSQWALLERIVRVACQRRWR